MRWGNCPHLAGGLQLGQALDGQQAVQVAAGEVRVDVQVVDLDILLGGRAGDDPVGRVAPPGVAALTLLVEGLVGFEGNPARAEQGNRALA